MANSTSTSASEDSTAIIIIVIVVLLGFLFCAIICFCFYGRHGGRFYMGTDVVQRVAVGGTPVADPYAMRRGGNRTRGAMMIDQAQRPEFYLVPRGAQPYQYQQQPHNYGKAQRQGRSLRRPSQYREHEPRYRDQQQQQQQYYEDEEEYYDDEEEYVDDQGNGAGVQTVYYERFEQPQYDDGAVLRVPVQQPYPGQHRSRDAVIAVGRYVGQQQQQGGEEEDDLTHWHREQQQSARARSASVGSVHTNPL